jgi:hypothetical protein
MRPVLIPVTGTTDASGNATLILPLERTGEWRNIKIALGTTGAPEWAVLRSGAPVTYGRGRRVTLGPELCEPFDVLTVSVTGAAALAPITGTVSGVSGSGPEVLPTYVPAPNTIALDTSSPSLTLVTQKTLAHAVQTSVDVQLTPGFHALGFLTTAPLNIASVVSITGDQTGASYFEGSSIFMSGFTVVPIVAPNPLLDTTVTVKVLNNSPSTDYTLWVFGLLDVEAMQTLNSGLPGTDLLVQNDIPAAWQTPNVAPLSVERSTTGTTPVRAGVAGQTIRVFGWQLQADAGAVAPSGQTVAVLEDDSLGSPNGRIGMIAASGAAVGMISGYHAGVPLTIGAGLRLNVSSIGSGVAVRALVGIHQS